MRLLDRYIIQQLLPPFLLSLTGITMFMASVSLVESLDFLFQYNAGLLLIAEMYLYATPYILVLAVPMSILLATLLAFGKLSGDSEVIAMKANGVSTARLFVPAFLFAIPLYGFSQWLYLSAMPWTQRQVSRRATELVTSADTLMLKPRSIVEFDYRTVVYVNDLSEDGKTAEGVFFFRDQTVDEQTEVYIAERLERGFRDGDQVYTFYNGTTHRLEPEAGKRYEMDRFSRSELLLESEVSGEQGSRARLRNLSLEELRQRKLEYLESGETSKYNRAIIEQHRRFSIPLACLIFPLFGIGLGIYNQRSGKSGGFGIAIGIFALFYMLMELGEGLGEKGTLPPVAAAWLPNVVLLALGSYLLWTVTQERPIVGSGALGLVWSGVKYVPEMGSILFSPKASSSKPETHTKTSRASLFFTVPFPTVIDRYVLRLFLGYYITVLSVSFVISLLTHFTERIGKGLEYGAAWHHLAEYFLLKNLYFLFIGLHFAMLVAVLIALGILSKNSEIIALKAGGMSTGRIAQPLVIMGIILTAFCFWYNDRVAPVARRVAEDTWQHDIKNVPRTRTFMRGNRWYRGPNNSLFRFVHYDANRQTIIGFSYFRFNEDFQIAERIEAEEVIWSESDQTWLTQTPQVYRFEDRMLVSSEAGVGHQSVALRMTPDDFSREKKRTSEMTYEELAHTISVLERSGYREPELETDLHAKVSQSFIGVIMLVLALPFGFVSPRQGGLMRGFGVATLLGLTFYVVSQVSLELGYSSTVAPLTAAWAPNALFAVFGLFSLVRLQSQ